MEECTQIEHIKTLTDLQARTSSLEESERAHPVFEVRITDLERRVDIMTERTHHYESKIDLMDKTLQILAEKQENMKERMPSRDEWNMLKKSIEDLTGKGGKTFDRIKDLILASIVSGLVAFVLLKVIAVLGK